MKDIRLLGIKDLEILSCGCGRIDKNPVFRVCKQFREGGDLISNHHEIEESSQ